MCLYVDTGGVFDRYFIKQSCELSCVCFGILETSYVMCVYVGTILHGITGSYWVAHVCERIIYALLHVCMDFITTIHTCMNCGSNIKTD